MNTFLNKNNEIWVNNICPNCGRDQRRRARGQTTREESKHEFVSKGVIAEIAAQKKFESLGMKVSRTLCFGPDLTCVLGDLTWTVEVKYVGTWTSDRSAKFPKYGVGPICEKRKNDDLVALYMPNGYVYIDDMQMHLKKCNKSGMRVLTSLVKEIGLTPLPTSKPTP